MMKYVRKTSVDACLCIYTCPFVKIPSLIMCACLVLFYCYRGAIEYVLARPLFLGGAMLNVKSLTHFSHQGMFVIILVVLMSVNILVLQNVTSLLCIISIG
jgi:hypothetical protein